MKSKGKARCWVGQVGPVGLVRPSSPSSTLSRRLFFLLLLLLACSSCAGRTPQLAHSDLRMVASGQGLEIRTLAAGSFDLVALAPATGKGEILRVYIEGDGRAWSSRLRLSPDPTPTASVALDLLAADPGGDKAYLARPCQFAKNPDCASRYWSSHRYSEEVVASMNQALDQLKATGGYRQLELVGHSGGGAIALLLAARRHDLRSVRTVAANLNHQWLNRYHRVSQLSGSLNPVEYAHQLAGLPQQHFFGADDRTVPAAVFDAYAASFPDRSCLQQTTVAGAEHLSGWRERWPGLLAVEPACAGFVKARTGDWGLRTED